MTSFLRVVSRAAASFDASPVSLASLGARLWRVGTQRAERMCLRDLEYARIEALREDPDRPGTVILLARELGLGLPEESYQRSLRHQHTPAWARLGLSVSRVRLARVLRTLVDHSERARRGWARTDAWNANHHLAAVAAGMLTQLAREGMSWPGESAEFPDALTWQEALEYHAAALARYSSEDPERAAALDAWHQLATDPETADSDAERAARQRMDDLDRLRLEQAQEAMRWIAEHFPDLWD